MDGGEEPYMTSIGLMELFKASLEADMQKEIEEDHKKVELCLKISLQENEANATPIKCCIRP
ncbi:hypothetical protein HanIR_Chr12g0579091 [Helianthus annuus]|nr:hypothetical protein HanIR_Chr12g0579091 [Helianthus annuus]